MSFRLEHVLMFMLQVFVIEQSCLGFDHCLAYITSIAKYVGKMDIFRVIPYVCTVKTGFATNRAHVLVLAAVAEAGVLLDKRV